MILFILVIAFLSFSLVFFLQQSKFGKISKGEAMENVKSSANYREGKFQNISHTPDLTEGVSYYAVMKEFFFGKKENVKPAHRLPSQKTDLLKLNTEDDILVWFGHSSYFIQLDGKKILVDPVLSGAASPVSFTTRSFAGTDVYTAEELPAIDYLFISHDHWDHLDHTTITSLRHKVGKVICGLGAAAHFEHWGFDKNQIIEKDWHEEFLLDEGFKVNTTSARHFSGRGLMRNQSLWMAYVLQTPSMKIYLGGDSGYDTHFKEVGHNFGPFDLAILECGQYDKSWKYIHMLPEEILPAAQDLKAKRLFPVHWGKFALSNHAWNDPIMKLLEYNKEVNMPMLTPMIGERVNLKDEDQVFSAWWM